MGLPGTYPGAKVVSPDQIRKMYAVKMDNTGAVQFSAAPTATNGHSSLDTTKTVTLGGVYKRNYIKGTLELNMKTGAGTATAWLLTPGGSTKLGSTTAGAAATSTTKFTLGPIDVIPPYSVKIKQANGTAVNTARVKSVKINDLTTIYAD